MVESYNNGLHFLPIQKDRSLDHSLKLEWRSIKIEWSKWKSYLTLTLYEQLKLINYKQTNVEGAVEADLVNVKADVSKQYVQRT